MKQHIIKTLVTIALAALFIGCEHETKPPKTEVRSDEPRTQEPTSPSVTPSATPRSETR
jgi:hypothetical protein